ncbi:sensor histidine kinase [Actinacidiphila oryziradicis]|uniref:histidine kinase n=1 Tax=Actinacidiphila oryziradicis TaxID=2571141 RepID=A0A4U0RLV0_9ACTN|nr:HAMP domain-containing sensor histidine kinase [Actinacidiphila oryziradicis]TJZ96813.1 HAMP domain-containing histidine kinase [Actinacidiphila oryziradicis]
MSLRNRVALAGGTVVLAALVLASLVLYPSIGAKLTQQHDATLVAAVQQAPDTIKAVKVKAATSGTQPAFFSGLPVDIGSTRLQLLPAPITPGPSPGFIKVGTTDQQVAAGLREPYFQDAEYGGVHYRVYTAPLPGSSGALIRAAMPMSAVSAPLGRLKALLIVITLAGGLLAALVARLAAGRVLRPVRRLTETVEHITATQDLTARIEVHGRDEIARLARAFASMTAAVDASVTTQRRLVADASHELRTPLTSLNTNLELLDEGLGVADPQAPELVGAAREQTRELMALVNDLIDLARYGHDSAHTEDTRLDLVALRVAERAAARATGLDIRTELAECLVHGDPDALERAAANLVDNAVKWSPAGGSILVRVSAQGTLTVTDEGPGIPVADLPYVFDRFYRSPTARALPGSGLGLAIVRQIAEKHGGNVAAQAPAGGGTRLCLSLPALPRTPVPASPH